MNLGKIFLIWEGSCYVDMTEGKKEQDKECLRGATGEHGSPSRQLSNFWGEEDM